jgi:GNAT superfamily N-acetyltransferase
MSFGEVTMVSIIKIDTQNKKQVNQFIQFHFDLYQGCPQWVPPFIIDLKTMLDRKKHPFYDHSDADFFLALRDEKVVGRIAALENKPFNEYHKTKDAEFYLFDSIDDQEVANTLFQTVFDWAKARGLNHIVGPKGFSPFDGYGIQVEGFEHRQVMNMMNYNYDYYPKLVENLGFEKEVDFVSCYIPAPQFHLDPRIHEISRRVQERGTFQVKRFKNKAELVSWADKIGKAYNDTFVQNWEYYPLTEREVKYVVDTIIQVANPRLIKIIVADDKVVGFLLGFQDVSEAMQRAKGKLNPFTVIDLLLEMRKTKWISLNGMGVLPEYHGRGGNALLYSEMEDTLKSFAFDHADLTQVAETTKQMRKDLENVGGKPYKNHRVYHKHI